MWRTILIWSVVAALVMFFFPIKFIGVWASMFIFPFIAVRQLRLGDRQSPVVAGLGYGALTGALSRFLLAIMYLISSVIIGGVGATTAQTEEALATTAVLAAYSATSGLIGLFTSPFVGAIVGGIAGMIAAGTAPKSKEA
jgi:hypothetical protein